MLKIQTACAAVAAASLFLTAACGNASELDPVGEPSESSGSSVPGTSPASPASPGSPETVVAPGQPEQAPGTGTDPSTGEQTAAVDPEGITKMYADDPAQAEQQWFLSEAPPLDSGDFRVGGKGTVENLGDGVYQFTPTNGTNPASARLYIGTTNTSWNDTELQLEGGGDWRVAEANGYFIGPEDYRDAEVTAYYKITESSDDDEMTFYWRGGAHPSEDVYPLQCIATKYKVQIQMKDLSSRAAKEYDHYDSPNSYAWNDTAQPKFDLASELGGSMVGKLIGQKLVIYDVKDAAGNVTSVKMELYVDTGSKDLETPDLSKQNWRLLAEYTDDGTNWPDPAAETYLDGCNGRKGQMFTWGGPYIALRLDNNVWNLYKMSVRPIVPVKLQ